MEEGRGSIVFQVHPERMPQQGCDWPDGSGQPPSGDIVAQGTYSETHESEFFQVMAEQITLGR